MAQFDRVLIVGTGFMGNALANAMHGNSVAREIYGVEPNEVYRTAAMGDGCYAHIEPQIDQVNVALDLAIVCTPVETVSSIVCELLRRFPQTIVTDITSVKQSIISEVLAETKAEMSSAASRFIPAHPITGSDRTGPIQPPASIFTDRSCVITPQAENSAQDLDAIEQLWTSLGSHVFRLDAEVHDQLLGMTSHMPHAVASALSAALKEDELKFCGTGIRDTIRIAKSNPLLWKQIFVHNRESILQAMDRFQLVFDEIRESLESDSVGRLISILEKGQKNRDALGN